MLNVYLASFLLGKALWEKSKSSSSYWSDGVNGFICLCKLLESYVNVTRASPQPQMLSVVDCQEVSYLTFFLYTKDELNLLFESLVMSYYVLYKCYVLYKVLVSASSLLSESFIIH